MGHIATMQAVLRHGTFVLAAVLAAAAAWMHWADASPYALLPALGAGLFVCAGVLARQLKLGTVLTALYGLGCSAYLFHQKLDTAGGKALCSIDTTIDCGKINGSEYSVVAGVPIALLGVAYYAAIAFAAVRSPSNTKEGGTFHQLNTILGLAGVGYAVFLAWASAQLGAVCVVCVTMYGVNGLLLAAGFVGLKVSGRTLTQNLGAAVGSPEAQSLAGLGVAVLVGGMVMFPLPQAGAAPKTTNGQPNWSALYAPAGNVELSGTEPQIGSRDARYEVVEFADFGCGHCARAKKELDELTRLRNDVSVRFKPFALSGSCNPSLEDRGTGADRCDAARAAQCANRQGKFWEMAELLFTNQGYFAPDQLAQMAAQAGLDAAAWSECMQDPSSMEEVRAAGAAGGQLGIRGTPALYLRGLFGPRWVEMQSGVPGILELIEANERGEKLAPPAATP